MIREIFAHLIEFTILTLKSSTVYKGLKESGLRAGQTVAIVGAGGGLGSLACQYAKAMGFDIIAIDGGSDKKEMTAKLGKLIYSVILGVGYARAFQICQN